MTLEQARDLKVGDRVTIGTLPGKVVQAGASGPYYVKVIIEIDEGGQATVFGNMCANIERETLKAPQWWSFMA